MQDSNESRIKEVHPISILNIMKFNQILELQNDEDNFFKRWKLRLTLVYCSSLQKLYVPLITLYLMNKMLYKTLLTSIKFT